MTATGHDHDRNQHRIGDGTSRSAVGHDLNTLQAPTAVQHGVSDSTSRGTVGHNLNTSQDPTAILCTDATSKKGKGVVADTGYPKDRGLAGAANDTYGHSKEIVNTTPPHDPSNAVDTLGVSPYTNVHHQGNRIAPSDCGKETHAIADTSHPTDAEGQSHSSRTA